MVVIRNKRNIGLYVGIDHNVANPIPEYIDSPTYAFRSWRDAHAEISWWLPGKDVATFWEEHEVVEL